MQTSINHYIKLCFFNMLSLILIFFSGTQTEAAKEIIFNKKTIVLDPGHGGYDTGAKGECKTMEKNIALQLAQMIKKKLGNRHKTILTRTDDYKLDLNSRTAVANHLKADIFISIHTGGSFLHNAAGINIFYFKELMEQTLSGDLRPPPADDIWSGLQTMHIKASGLLAELMQKSIQEREADTKVRLQSCPLFVLESADMPAVLIETGYISNPVEEKEMNDINKLQVLADSICAGIEKFFLETALRNSGA